MSSDEEPPKFKVEPEHVFAKDEKVYVIDENGFDIYAAEITEVGENSWKIHFPEYPEDDFTANDTKRILAMNKENKEIFEEQENVRLCKNLEEEDLAGFEEEEDKDVSEEPDDPDDRDASIDEEE